MNLRIVDWNDVDPESLRNLYMHFPYPPYFGSPIVDENLQAYRFSSVAKAAAENPDRFLVALGGGSRVLAAAQLRRTDHLSNHFGIEVATVSNEAFVTDGAAENYQAFKLLLQELRMKAEKRNVTFVTATAASQAFQWIRALEDAGFRYADGFRHVTCPGDADYSEFYARKDLVIRDLVESDYDEIEYGFLNVPYPNHLLHEPEFDKRAVAALYVKRFREVNEQVGKVFVGELNGQFAAALNGIIDRDLKESTGLVVNHLSQGIIVHPRAASKGVALSLIAYRHAWYAEQGMKLGYFGSNINNLPMIRGLEKLRAKHVGIEISMMLRLKGGQ